MKKVIIALILVLSGFLLVPFSYQKVYAKSELNYETIYPDNIIDYANLDNISNFSINDNYIAYTLDKNSVFLFNKKNKEYNKIDNFNTIQKIKFFNNYLLISDTNSIKILDINNIKSNANELQKFDISLINLKAIDIYTDNNIIYIATITNNIFKLYSYNIDLKPNTTNPLKSIESEYFNNSIMLAINNDNAYIIYSNDNEIKPNGLCVFNYESNKLTIKDSFIPNAKVFDSIKYKSKEFLLTFTNDIFYLLNTDGSPIFNVNVETNTNFEDNHFPILNITDIEYYNNKIYISDSKYKTIQTFDILENNQEIQLKSQEIILASSGFDKGRFNNVSDIFIQGNKIFTADSNNNRIHYIEDNKSHFINCDNLETNPNNIILDNENNLYFTTKEQSINRINKYKMNDNTYTFESKYTRFGDKNIGNISSICSTNLNTIYLLDYTNNKLLYLSGNSIKESEIKIPSELILDSNSEIKYLKSIDKLLLLNKNTIYLLDYVNKNVINKINVANCVSITVDINNIFAITNNDIKLISIDNNSFIQKNESISLNNQSNLKHLTFDIVNRYMIAFDSNRSCLVKFKCDISPMPFLHKDITTKEPIKETDMLLALKIKNNSLIYEYPYSTGKLYNNDNNIKECLGIDTYGDYYEILFSQNNTLILGYILKSNVEIVEYEYNPINVLTTNKNVPIYKYPTLLKYNGDRIITNTVKINTPLTLIYKFPISIDGKYFYTYKDGENIGFIFGIDVVTNENSNIKNLNVDNATIKLIGEKETYLLDNDKQTKLKPLKNNSRIYVQNYDKNNKYTLVIYKDENLNTYTGYLETKDIQMDKLDNTQLVLIIIISITIILLIAIIIAYFIIKKKK